MPQFVHDHRQQVVTRAGSRAGNGSRPVEFGVVPGRRIDEPALSGGIRIDDDACRRGLPQVIGGQVGHRNACRLHGGNLVRACAGRDPAGDGRIPDHIDLCLADDHAGPVGKVRADGTQRHRQDERRTGRERSGRQGYHRVGEGARGQDRIAFRPGQIGFERGIVVRAGIAGEIELPGVRQIVQCDAGEGKVRAIQVDGVRGDVQPEQPVIARPGAPDQRIDTGKGVLAQFADNVVADRRLQPGRAAAVGRPVRSDEDARTERDVSYDVVLDPRSARQRTRPARFLQDDRDAVAAHGPRIRLDGIVDTVAHSDRIADDDAVDRTGGPGSGYQDRRPFRPANRIVAERVGDVEPGTGAARSQNGDAVRARQTIRVAVDEGAVRNGKRL